MCRLMDVDARANLMRIRTGSMMDRNEQESAWTQVSQRAHSMLEALGSLDIVRGLLRFVSILDLISLWSHTAAVAEPPDINRLKCANHYCKDN